MMDRIMIVHFASFMRILTYFMILTALDENCSDTLIP